MILISGTDLRRMRERSKKTTVEMAKRVGVSRNTYENWEKDVGQPKVNQFILLCTYCAVDLSPLINQFGKFNNKHSVNKKGNENGNIEFDQ
ncbi:helix-turn-helix transcriptional regulator [Pseudoalteromonas ruthenica]|uniref:helix-turn-helix transcriptional regulator n=1 Tax=Pseudoalteromonas ruthenica TaxID=151081 RepID=UPI00110B0E50|nr:helix-turn-helix transcriptional regulator [Pseudoalteromonas ruthenica]TMO97533.1 XRE family transcriptional regulator [Pseudoalteromonas ruthenica]